jgi:hypothetical protein
MIRLTDPKDNHVIFVNPKAITVIHSLDGVEGTIAAMGRAQVYVHSVPAPLSVNESAEAINIDVDAANAPSGRRSSDGGC